MRPAAARFAHRLSRHWRVAGLLVAVLLVFGPSSLTRPRLAFAVTRIPTTTYTSNATWTTGGSPYVLDGDVTVAAGATLTIDPGVVVKLNGTFRELRVSGTLAAVGTSANPIVFTSYQDDTAGGDTNGDGAATSGAAGQWWDLLIQSGNANTQLKFVTVRYGGWGGANWNYGALNVTGSGTSVLVEDSTFSQNQTSGIHVGTQDTAGVTVRRTTLSNNGDGISANGGWVTLANSTVRDNSEDGLWWNLLSTFTGPTSTVMDSDVRNNGRRGVYLQVDSGLDASRWPHGNRNNIYANTAKQLELLSTKRGVDWKNNYWGDGVYHYFNDGACQGQGQNSIGKLAFRASQASPPDGPIYAGTYQVGTSTCAYDQVAIGALEYSPFPFRGAIGQPLGQSIGACLGKGEFAVRASECMQDPVNSATGSFTHAETDLTLPGTGVSVEFTRSYNSIDPTTGPLGAGWTHSYNAALTVRANGDVTARAGSGQQLEFIKNSDGSFTAADGGRATLTSVTGGYELLTNDQLKYRFDTAGKLTSLKDRNEKGLTFAYDGNGRLSTITDATNRQITLAYDGSGLLTSVTAPGPRTVSYGYTGGRLTSVTDAASKVWTYTYEAKGLLEKEIDPLQHALFRNVYGTDGRVLEQYDALNNKTSFAWDSATHTQTATDARNGVWKDVYSNGVLQKRIDALTRETQFVRDSALNETSVTGPDGKTTTMSYDSRGNLTQAVAPASLGGQKTLTFNSRNDVTSVTDARGKVTSYGYDANGNNTSVVQDGITVASYAYNASGQLTSFTNGRNYTTSYAYDSTGNLESETDPLGNKTTYGYNAAGRMTSRVEPRGNVQGADPNQYKWTYTYDGAGRTLTEADPLGNTTTYVYDNAGNRGSVTDARNKTTTYSYDANNRVLTITAPDTGVTTYTYDAVGNKATERNPNNQTTTYGYDANNRLTSVTTPLGNKTTYTYDVSGNLIKQVEPRGNVQGANPDDYATTYTYDAAGRLLTETDPLGHVTTYTYDAVGNKTSLKDANDHTTSYSYDGLNRLTSITAPGGAATTYTYDAANNLTTRTDPNNHVTTYGYDADDRLTSMTLPLNRQWTYAYDAAGNRTQIVDANGNATQTAGDGTTTSAYDRAGRLTAIDYSDTTPDISYSYDGVGNRTQMSDGAGTQTYSYDNVNRLASVTRGTDTFAYTYDLAGNLTRRTYPDSTVIDYAYDNDSRLASVTTGGQATSYAYDAAANIVTTTLPTGNGYVEERTYDRAGRITRVKNVKAGSTLSDFTYTLDSVGSPTQVVRAGTAAGTSTFSYDARDRLTEVCFQASCPGGSDPFIRWTYDAVGNRLTEARPSGTTNYSYNAADELTQAGATTYAYDQNGNQTQAGSRTFNYDVANRMTSTTSGAETTTYSHDGDGVRVVASTGASTLRYSWDTSRVLPHLALERNGSGGLVRRYTYGVRRISMFSGGSNFFYHYDALGSVANLTSSTGASEWTYAYEPFGSTQTETRDDPSAPDNPMQFVGEMRTATGLYALRARDYDSGLGRFNERDPLDQVSLEAASSAYIYASNRPTVLIDPSGMRSQPSDAGQAAAADATSPSRQLALPDSLQINAPEGTSVDPGRYPTLAALQLNMEKLLFGEIRGGRLVGVHFEGPEGGYLRSLQTRRGLRVFSRSRPDGKGVYRGRVSKEGAPQSKGSSFFPASWTLGRLLEELDYALKPEALGGGLYKLTLDKATRTATFYGRTTTGIRIEGRANERYGFDTVFPIFGA